MGKETENIIEFIVVCISEFARRHGLAPSEAFNYLDFYGAVEFVREHYDTLHTFSIDNVTDDMAEFCTVRGGALR